ncbi:Putative transport protein [Klebsiella pneumoniae IS39]|nr:Putative transport protein [Klebsiella pneumoniae IS39]
MLRHQLAYGGGNLLGSGALAISGAWLLYFYTTFCGLTLIEASFIFSVASIIDAISNPLMGYLTDNFGKNAFGQALRPPAFLSANRYSADDVLPAAVGGRPEFLVLP